MEEADQSFIDSLLGERIAGRYVIERVVRSGGMGVVAAGRYPELDQQVAIKFMRPELAANAILSARFLREARLAARVKSPHFVRVFDFGRLDTGVPYLVMEMLEGRDLRDELEKKGALPVEVTVDYVLQASVGLAEVHSLGIVHRDLKPSNLFLSEAAGAQTIKVLDFGVSKEQKGEEGTALTSTGNLVGTPHYMSPEQVRESKNADVRSDVWSLGVILYELLTDEIPFGGGGEAIGEVYGMILHTEPIAVGAHRIDLPAGLEAVVHKCLRRDPSERYPNVGELAEALRPFASATSIGHIGAIHQALASAGPRVASDGDPGSLPRAPLSATAATTPSGKKNVAPSLAAPRPAADAKPTTVVEMSMNAPRSPAFPRERPRRRVVVWGSVAAILATAGLGVTLLRGESTPTSAQPSASSGESRATPAPAPVVAPSAAPQIAPSAISSATIYAASSSSASEPPQHAKHRAAPPAPVPAAATASASPTASPEDLILDRK